MSELVKVGRRYVSELMEILRDPVGNKLVAAAVLGLMAVYVVGGLSAVFWLLVGAALLWFIPRIRKRLTKWYLLR